ncbi:MAG: DUF4013 domain-containing protein [Deltaproteobacteria bacterium]|uniref:DUF4013 domain-containing protein n=1 Tax=Candidatus Zymogenus saltonus TaxID=2844893 RepID=A0A9D8KD99_9DELT|nr:DUF4013 domain-containing protein [Candidatus Zymogenus saltonus]
MEKIVETLIYPVNGRKTSLKFLLGCAINLVPLLGNAVAAGYAMRGMREIMVEREGMPLWNDFMGLFLSGGKFILALVVYGIPFFIPFSIGMFLFVVVKSAWAVLLGFFIVMIGTILALSSAYIFPMAIIYMLKCDERLKTIFAFSEVLLNIRKAVKTYTINVLIVWLVSLVFFFICYLLMSIKFGYILVIIPLFYLLLVATNILGKLGADLGDVVIDRVSMIDGDLNW